MQKNSWSVQHENKYVILKALLPFLLRCHHLAAYENIRFGDLAVWNKGQKKGGDEHKSRVFAFGPQTSQPGRLSSCFTSLSRAGLSQHKAGMK